jgi:hypothetical protein
LVVTVPELRVKLALLCPLAIVTLAGTLSGAVVLSATLVAAVTAVLIDTVHALDPLLDNAADAQESDVSCAGATILNVVLWEAPFSVAVIDADPLAVTAATVVVKVAVFCPAINVTEAGKVTL